MFIARLPVGKNLLLELVFNSTIASEEGAGGYDDHILIAMTSNTPTTFREAVELNEIVPGQYVSKYNPERMGNTLPIAYGGCTLATAIAAAHVDLDCKYHLYSAQGNYLGPASTEKPLFAHVRKIRETKSFATRQVEISQEQKDGSKRSCLIMIADFHVKENKSVLTYSAPPETKFTPVDECETMEVALRNAVENGHFTAETLNKQRKMFSLMTRYFEQKPTPEGFAEQIMGGMNTRLPTTQDHLSPTSRTSADWFKNRVPLTSAAEQVCALSFEMDAKISFLPGLHNRLFLNEVGACSSFPLITSPST